MKKNKETRDRILNSAKKEFAEFGYDGARMGSIAKRANANQALLHYYFESKEKLYEEVLKHYFAIDDVKLITERVAEWNLSIEQELYMGIYLLVKFPLGALDSEFSQIMAREVSEGRNHLKNIMNNYVLPKLIQFQDVIQRGIDAGIFETVNAYMVVMQLIVFIITYENIKNTSNSDGGLSWIDIIPSSNKNDEVFRFLLTHTIKGLTPEGEMVKIPEFSENHIKELDKLIEEIGKMRTLSE
jgi:AcrR family transcriptional regulator